MHWIAENTDEGWQPTLDTNGCMFSLPLWFATEKECLAFIDTIPAGDPSDPTDHEWDR